MKKLQTIHPLSLLLATMMMALIFISAPNLFAKNADAPWHVASGEYLIDSIFQENTFPYEDPFSFSPHEEIWVNPAWLYNAALGAITKTTSLGFAVLFTSLLGGGLVFLVTQHLIHRNIPALAITCGMFLHMSLMASGIAIRPQIMTLYGVAILYILLHRARKNSNYLWWIPPLFTLWSNVHGGLVIGFVVLGAFGLEAMLQKNWRQFSLLFITGLASILASLINPYSWELYDLIYRTMAGVMRDYIEEWGSPFAHNRWHLLAFYLLLFVICLPRKSLHLPFADLLLMVITLILATLSIRHLSLLGVLGAVVFCTMLQHRFGHYPYWQSYQNRWHEWLHSPSAKKVSYFLFAILCSALLLVAAFWPKWQETLISSAEYPVAEYEYLIENCQGCNTFAFYDYAGSLLYLSKGKVPVFYDSRAENVYSQQILKDGIHITTLQNGWQALLNKYKVQAVLMPRNHPIFPWLEKEGSWQFAFRGKYAEIWIRKKQLNN